jgi:hypothetical protein
MYAEYDNNFGTNFFTQLAKEAAKPVQRAVNLVKAEVKTLAKGDIVRALDITNPISVVTQLVSDNPNLINYARATMPQSIMAIDDKKIRNAAIAGWVAAAATVATAGYAVPALTGTTLTSLGTAIVAGSGVAAGAGAATIAARSNLTGQKALLLGSGVGIGAGAIIGIPAFIAAGSGEAVVGTGAVTAAEPGLASKLATTAGLKLAEGALSPKEGGQPQETAAIDTGIASPEKMITETNYTPYIVVGGILATGYLPLIQAASAKYGVPIALILAHIKQESNFDEKAYRYEPAINDASYGLMQVLLATAKTMDSSATPEKLFDPAYSIDIGTQYIAKNLARYANVIPDAVAAYNAGSAYKNAAGQYTAKSGSLSVNDYVNRVMGYYQDYLDWINRGSQTVDIQSVNPILLISFGALFLALVVGGILYARKR